MNSITSYATSSRVKWERFSIFAVCCLAFSVSLGAALVSLSKALILTAVLGRIWLDGWGGVKAWLRQSPPPIWITMIAIIWVATSGFWTSAEEEIAVNAFIRHARLIWLVAVLFLIRIPADAFKVLTWLAVGQISVVMMSWLTWLGAPIPFAKQPELGILFTSTLEQPVMGTLLVVLLWSFRERFTHRDSGWLTKAGFQLLLTLTITNTFLVMTGRTGYLVMLIFLGWAAWHTLPRKMRFLAFISPAILATLLYYSTPNFYDRTNQVALDVAGFQANSIQGSQALRLEMWRVSLVATRDRPWTGHGVGSYPRLYERYGGRDPNGASHPHQQYLFWLSEFGIIGLTLLLAIFVSLIRHARRLPPDASFALTSTVLVAAVMSLANCPFYGVGMGEFFLLMMAALIGTQKVGDFPSDPRHQE